MASITLYSPAGGRFTLTVTATSSGNYVTANAYLTAETGSFDGYNCALTVTINGLAGNTQPVTALYRGNSASVSASGSGAYGTTYTVVASWDGGGTYPPASGSVTETVTTGAQPSWTISYNANGGTGAPASQTKQRDISVTLSSTKPTRSGYVFVGWNTNSGGTGTWYQPGQTYSANANLNLYAQWARDIWIKLGGTWRRGVVWIKIGGTWRRSVKVWKKVNGTWRGSN